ncbi:MAG: hypothetical protein LBG04_02280 [Holosporaceae bacterium]|jgi:hypothetical protein|nr:hypothetical protein [Holosporaceae bacterium]
MHYITMRGLSLAIARIGEQIESAIRERHIEMNEDDTLKEALDDLKHIANVLYEAIEDEKLNN